MNSPTNPTNSTTSIDELVAGRRRADGSDLAVIGLLLLLVGLMFVVEIFGPSSVRTARVTTSVEVDRFNRVTDLQIVRGIDEEGAGFEIRVSESVRNSLQPDDRVEVTRSWLTGRVLSVRAETWSHDVGGWRLVVGLGAAAIGAVLSLFGLRSMLRASRSDQQVDWKSALMWPAVFALALNTGYVLYERDQASTSSARAAYEATLTTEPAVEDCQGLSVAAGQQLFALVKISKDAGELDAEDFGSVVSIIQGMEPGCTPESVEAEVCAYIADVVDGAPEFVVSTGGRCPDFP